MTFVFFPVFIKAYLREKIEKMIEVPSHIKGLIFDLDGTVANTMQNHFVAWKEAGGQ